MTRTAKRLVLGLALTIVATGVGAGGLNGGFDRPGDLFGGFDVVDLDVDDADADADTRVYFFQSVEVARRAVRQFQYQVIGV